MNSDVFSAYPSELKRLARPLHSAAGAARLAGMPGAPAVFWTRYGHPLCEAIPSFGPKKLLLPLLSFLLRFPASLLFRSGWDRISRGDLRDTLVQCHRWLGQRNVDYLLPFIAPLWEDAPAELARVSEKAIAWTLLACMIERHGPEALAIRGGLRSWSGFVECFGLGPEDPPGDWLALHLNVEHMARLARNRMGAPLADGPDTRRPGGLRSRDFIDTVASLRMRTGHQPAWLAAIDALARNSPLTRIIYADVLEADHAVPLCLPNMAAPAAVGWHDVWFALLAKSLVGALASSTPLSELLEVIEARLAELRVRQDAWFRRHPGAESSPFDAGIAGQQHARDSTRGRRQSECCERLQMLGDLFQKKDARFLHVLFLDMLMRHVVTSSIGDLRRLCAAAAAAEIGKQPGAPFGGRMREICSDRLARMLLGADRTGIGAAAWPAMPEEHLAHFLEHDTADATEQAIAQIARESGIITDTATKVLSRFARAGIGLPFPAPHHRSRPPAELLTDCSVEIRNSFPSVTVSSQTE